MSLSSTAGKNADAHEQRILKPASATLTEALADSVQRRPDAVAIQDGDRQVTYDELWSSARALAETLVGRGVGAGTIVAIRTPRGWQQIVAVCAVLAAGASYLPVDPTYPQAVQDFMLGDSTAAAVLDLVDGRLTLSVLDPTDEPSAPPPGTAYILYTSGSTGTPKGVLVGHEHVLALLESCFSLFEVGETDSWTLFHSCSFDFSVWEIWGCLLSGGRLVIVDQATLIDPAAFVDLLRDQTITVASLVPSVFAVVLEYVELLETHLADLRYLVFGGEAVNLAALERWAGLQAAPSCTVVNMYGITETTVHATFAILRPPISSLRDGTTPIGRALPHLTIRVVDVELRPVPAGTVGEMLLTGRSVAFGYWRRPESTADRFVTVDGQRYYRSGDRGYVDDVGSLHFVGRTDDQVKVRGHRIELAEVEAALRSHPAVSAGACTVEVGPAGHGILVANVVLVPRAAALPEPEQREQLKRFLQSRLPAHKVPTRYRFHDALPLTHSGKIDRRRLVGDR